MTEIPDAEIVKALDRAIVERARTEYFPLRVQVQMREQVFHAIRGYDCLEEIFKEKDITEIMVNGYRTVFVERHGKIECWKRGFVSEEKYMDVIQQIVAGCNRIVNESSPIVDARLPDGSRVNIVLPPIALDGAVLTIRRFPEKTYSMDDLFRLGMLSEEIKELLRLLVISRYNILISGGTGSGKTTLLNALGNYIPKDERIITIEDSAELRISGIANLVRLEVRNANVEGKNEISIRELIRTSLRMRPSRIVVGEVRGAEAIDMLQAMNTGHSGSLSTGHANSSRDMLYRLETMVLMGMELPLVAIRQQIASAIDILIHIGRLPDGSRRVMNMSEVDGIKNGEIILHPLFQYVEEAGVWEQKGGVIHEEKLKHTGCWETYQKVYEEGTHSGDIGRKHG